MDKKKLHILFLCSWYPSKVLLANGDFIQRHAEAVSLQHKVSVLHIISNKNATQKIEINTQNINGVNTHIAYVKYTVNPFVKLFRFIKAYKQLLRKIDSFDLVHLNTLFPFGMFALHQKYFNKKQFIISEHWTGYHKPRSENIPFFQKAISKIITKNASFVCPVSDNLKDAMQDIGLKGNYDSVPNVVDTNLFQPIVNKPNDFTVVHISSMIDEHKNISGMLEVAKIVENEMGNFTWKFIGGTPDKYTELIKSLQFTNSKIQFIDHLSQAEMVKHLQSAHLFVLFSNYENLPCVILEAFSCGVPVISTDVGGISEYFPNDFGFLIEKQNKVQLAEKIIEVRNTPFNNSKAMHLYAKEHFSQEAIANKFSELYYKTLK